MNEKVFSNFSGSGYGVGNRIAKHGFGGYPG
jgi:hypothetical protein